MVFCGKKDGMKRYLLAALCAFVLSGLFSALLLPILRKMKAGQNVLSYVKEHKKKEGTPTMGGLAFILAIVLTAILFVERINRGIIVTLVVTLAYMLVGFLDDYLKRKHKKNLGLRAWQKFAFQLAIALVVAIFCFRAGFTKQYIPFWGESVDFGAWSIPFTTLVFLATVNAVNLTDGLDGLAAGTSTTFLLSLAALVILEKGDGAQTLVCFCGAGALSAYLILNIPPAKIFMGDTGSLALGGLIACTCSFTGNALYLPVAGLPFVLSVLSVIIQVIYYKVSGGKRVFLMSPLHHHFQKRGHSESRISYAYALGSALLGVVCVAFIL